MLLEFDGFFYDGTNEEELKEWFKEQGYPHIDEEDQQFKFSKVPKSKNTDPYYVWRNQQCLFVLDLQAEIRMYQVDHILKRADIQLNADPLVRELLGIIKTFAGGQK